jgi:ribosomal protein S24E
MTPNKQKLYLIYGLLLGNSLIMKNNSDLKLIIEIECKYTTFLTEVYNKVSSLVDCDNKLTVIKTKLCKGGQLNKVMFLHTYSNNHYLELYNKWYKNKSNKNIPLDIMNYFNEVSLAY